MEDQKDTDWLIRCTVVLIGDFNGYCIEFRYGTIRLAKHETMVRADLWLFLPLT
tara:strand:+ start:498 stop:659 length:162 start_codon:yes stop_codon:yes gene_type:complete